MNVLVVAPHPDDEVLGCGGTIAKHHQKGDHVYLCIATAAYPPQWSEDYIARKAIEIQESSKILGIEQVFQLNLPTAKLDTLPQKELNDSLSALVDGIAPEVAYIPHQGDLNRDHRILFESALVALRPIKRKIRKILSYETLSETEWGIQTTSFIPNAYVDISGTIDRKIDAMRAYSTELREMPHPRSIGIIEAHARKRGSEIGTPYAEAFSLIRSID